MKDKEMEKFIDECYDIMFQREGELRELGLVYYGDSSYYIQNPDEYEKDKKICELENEVKRLERRLSNCIELPIPIGEKCWTINCYKTYGDVKNGEPFFATRYELHENIVSGYDIYKSMINDKLTLNVVPRAKTNYTGVQPYLFATEEEAKAKLEELKK